MPIYEYECLKCCCRFDELIFDVEEEKGLKCPECSSKKIERRFSTFSSTTNEPGKHANDPSAQKEKMQEKAERPTVGMDHLNQYFH